MSAKKSNLPYLFLSLTFILVAIACYDLSTFALRQIFPFDADEAHHAARGLDLYDALRSLKPLSIFYAVIDQAFYPPLHSLTVATSYLALDGPSLASSRLPSWIAFLLSILVTSLAVRESLRQSVDIDASRHIPYGMGVALLLSFFSPLSIQNASIVMLEPLSMMMTALIIYIFTRHEGTLQHSAKAALLLGFVLALAILTKYTMIVFVVAPAVVALWGIPGLTSKLAFRATAITSVLVIGLFGGWLLISHWEGVWYFLFGFPKRGVSISLPGLFVQPRMFFERCALDPTFAWIALALGLYSLRQALHQRAILFSILCIVATLTILGVSAQQGGRFMLHAVPCVWFLSGIGAVRFAAQSSRYLSPMTREAALWVLLLLVSLTAILQRERLQRDILFALETTNASVQMLALVTRSADPKQPILQIGSNDLFNIEAVRWTLSASSGIPYRDLTVDQFPMTHERLEKLRYVQPWSAPFEKYQRLRNSGLRQILEERGYKTLIVFESDRWLRNQANRVQIEQLLGSFPHTRWSDGVNSVLVVSL